MLATTRARGGSFLLTLALSRAAEPAGFQRDTQIIFASNINAAMVLAAGSRCLDHLVRFELEVDGMLFAVGFILQGVVRDRGLALLPGVIPPAPLFGINNQPLPLDRGRPAGRCLIAPTASRLISSSVPIRILLRPE